MTFMYDKATTVSYVCGDFGHREQITLIQWQTRSSRIKGKPRNVTHSRNKLVKAEPRRGVTLQETCQELSHSKRHPHQPCQCQSLAEGKLRLTFGRRFINVTSHWGSISHFKMFAATLILVFRMTVKHICRLKVKK